MAASPTYTFKRAARIPRGVSADGVWTEREKIVKGYGKATIALSTTAVLSEPKKFPNLRAFAPTDPEEALEICVADGIRHAYSSLIPVFVSSTPGAPEPREVRVLFPVPDADGDLVYEPVQVIKKSPEQRRYLIKRLREDAQSFTTRLQDVLSEIEEAV